MSNIPAPTVPFGLGEEPDYRLAKDIIEEENKTIHLPDAFRVSLTKIRNSAFRYSPIDEESYSATEGFPNVTEIGDYAFDHCIRLYKAHFPKATKIGSYAFYNASALRLLGHPGLGVPASFPKVTSIPDHAFTNCTRLGFLYFPEATRIGTYAFSYVSTAYLYDFPKATIIDMYAFAHSGTNNGDFFYYFSFPQVKTIGVWAFAGCSTLKTMEFPEAVTIGANAFQNTCALETLSIPKCETLSAAWGTTSLAASSKSTLLTKLELPSVQTIVAKTFGSSATDQHTGIVDLYLPHKTIAEVKAMDNYATWYLSTDCTIHAADGDFKYGS